MQIFVKQDDNYQNNMPISYKYRLDNAYREHPIKGCCYNHTLIKGADGDDLNENYYDVPDINNEDVDYDFFIERWEYDPGTGTWSSVWVDFFPLFDLTNEPGPLRIVLSDDDKDYPDFSRRGVDDYATNIETYNVGNGSYSSKYTGFTVDQMASGSGDDPFIESGVRKITESNAKAREDSFGDITAEYQNSKGTFRYKFGLIAY